MAISECNFAGIRGEHLELLGVHGISVSTHFVI